MFNDKMDIDDMILDLSTRATDKFCGKDERQYVAVSFQSHKEIPDYWQTWLTHYNEDVIVPSILDRSLMDGKTMRQALISLDVWFQIVTNTADELLEEDRIQIVESTGFGD